MGSSPTFLKLRQYHPSFLVNEEICYTAHHSAVVTGILSALAVMETQHLDGCENCQCDACYDFYRDYIVFDLSCSSSARTSMLSLKERLK